MKYKNGRSGVIRVKIDIQRVCDKMEWKFILVVLRKFGLERNLSALCATILTDQVWKAKNALVFSGTAPDIHHLLNEVRGRFDRFITAATNQQCSADMVPLKAIRNKDG
ncbi:hypothetical protein L484_004448 [Morus notabilis]|uniref:Uncharacterized protein n=1 Tax=Morus notabilis TaxID=981085 RepID=W9RFU8_9ROSA|nr:hypothetical protein L484_004448 [Morus notabilis]